MIWFIANEIGVGRKFLEGRAKFSLWSIRFNGDGSSSGIYQMFGESF